MLESGYVFGCAISSHRHEWNGTICKDPVQWNCGRDEEFREAVCDRGIRHCFHINTFNPDGPQFIFDAKALTSLSQWALSEIVDQYILFWGKRFSEPRGCILGPAARNSFLFGAYRIEKATMSPDERRITLEPYENDWVRFPPGLYKAPLGYTDIGRYLKEVSGQAVLRLLENISLDMASPEAGKSWELDEQERFKSFFEGYQVWHAAAVENTVSRTENRSIPSDSPLPRAALGTLGDIVGSISLNETTETPEETLDEVSMVEFVDREPTGNIESDDMAMYNTEETDDLSGEEERVAERTAAMLPEKNTWEYIRESYGPLTLRNIRVALKNKKIVIFSGQPGVGKSRLARQLLDDPRSERTVVIPVSSTWRGREDLLGYVNPVSSEFEPTEFTEFLLSVEAAWKAGDRGPRTVIFEEFNLSQPEHWLSDIIVRTEYCPDDLEGRTIHLGGTGIRGYGGASSKVFLSPNLYFVCTVNVDHTVRPLSPRVIDRASVIELRSGARESLRRGGVSAKENTVAALEHLNRILASKSIAFSIRTAISFHSCLSDADNLGLDEAGALDVVLTQEMLAKVRLLAGDPRDEQLIQELLAWSEQEYCSRLIMCIDKVTEWKELMDMGRDVNQV